MLSIYKFFLGENKTRNNRVSAFDPDDNSTYHSKTSHENNNNYIAPPTLGSQRKFVPSSQKVATICQTYNEKSTLLSSDEEYH